MQNSIGTVSFAEIIELAKEENYKEFNKDYKENGIIDSKISFRKILDNYIQKITSIKFNGNTNLSENFKRFTKTTIEHLTGDYEIGKGEVSFEELTDYSEIISSVIAYSNNEELIELAKSPEDLANGVVDGTIGHSIIPSNNTDKAYLSFISLYN